MRRISSAAVYMGLGALIALVGFILGNMVNSINAQSDTTVDKIVVKELYVVDDLGNTVMVLGKQHQSNATAIFRAYDTAGNPVLFLGYDALGGVVNVQGKEDKSGAGLGIDLEGGNLGIISKTGKLGGVFGVYPNGGRMEVYGGDGKGATGLSITDTGDGIIGTIDKFGNVTATIP